MDGGERAGMVLLVVGAGINSELHTVEYCSDSIDLCLCVSVSFSLPLSGGGAKNLTYPLSFIFNVSYRPERQVAMYHIFRTKSMIRFYSLASADASFPRTEHFHFHFWGCKKQIMPT